MLIFIDSRRELSVCFPYRRRGENFIQSRFSVWALKRLLSRHNAVQTISTILGFHSKCLNKGRGSDLRGRRFSSLYGRLLFRSGSGSLLRSSRLVQMIDRVDFSLALRTSVLEPCLYWNTRLSGFWVSIYNYFGAKRRNAHLLTSNCRVPRWV